MIGVDLWMTILKVVQVFGVQIARKASTCFVAKTPNVKVAIQKTLIIL